MSSSTLSLSPSLAVSSSARSMTRAQKRKAKAERKRVRQLISTGAIPRSTTDWHLQPASMTSSTMQMIQSCDSKESASERVENNAEESCKNSDMDGLIADWELVEDEETDEWVHIPSGRGH